MIAKRTRLLAVASLAALAAAAPPARAKPVHDFLAVAISPDGAHVASVEGDETPSGRAVIRNLVIRSTGGGSEQVVKLPCGAGPECTPSSPTWTADGKHLAFVLR